MIEISDSTATRRSERKMGKGRRAIDATTMMGMGGIRLVAVARVVEFGPAGDDTRLSCRQCFSSAILGQRDTHSKISEMVILVARPAGRSRGVVWLSFVRSRLFSSCEGIIDGAFDFAAHVLLILETYISDIRYQEKKRECVVFLYFSFQILNLVLRFFV